MFRVENNRLNRSVKLELETGPVDDDDRALGTPSSLQIQVHPETTILDISGSSPIVQLSAAGGKSRSIRVED